VKAGLRRGALLAAALTLTLAATTACGGNKSTQGPATTAQSGQTDGSSTADSSTLQLSAQIKSRLASAGYVVHDVKLPRPTIRGPVDLQALSHGPQQTFVAVSGDTDRTFVRLHDELVVITRQARERAVANQPMTKAIQQKLATLSANLADLSRHELSVYVFNSADDAASYATQIEAQNTHVLSLPGSGDINKYKAVGPVVYFADVLENAGQIKFDQGAFDKFIAAAEGQH
jgi:hypothetical protein